MDISATYMSQRLFLGFQALRCARVCLEDSIKYIGLHPFTSTHAYMNSKDTPWTEKHSGKSSPNTVKTPEWLENFETDSMLIHWLAVIRFKFANMSRETEALQSWIEVRRYVAIFGCIQALTDSFRAWSINWASCLNKRVNFSSRVQQLNSKPTPGLFWSMSFARLFRLWAEWDSLEGVGVRELSVFGEM